MRYAKQIVVAAVCVFAIATPSAAQSVAAGPIRSIAPPAAADPITSLSYQAERLATTLALQNAAATTAVQDEAAEQSKRKRALTVGLIGVGTAVAGMFVYQSAEDTPRNLPGITSGGKAVGMGMMAGGGFIGALGLWQGLK